MSRKTLVPILPLDRDVPKAPGFDHAQIGLIAVEAHLITNFEFLGLFSGHAVQSVRSRGCSDSHNHGARAAEYRQHG
jgi:hypothetical protein